MKLGIGNVKLLDSIPQFTIYQQWQLYTHHIPILIKPGLGTLGEIYAPSSVHIYTPLAVYIST
jgi:hypothetical protein